MRPARAGTPTPPLWPAASSRTSCRCLARSSTACSHSRARLAIVAVLPDQNRHDDRARLAIPHAVLAGRQDECGQGSDRILSYREAYALLLARQEQFDWAAKPVHDDSPVLPPELELVLGRRRGELE